MTLKNIDNRDTSADIIRIIAVFLVICVHFFLMSGFYGQNIDGFEMYPLVTMRTLSGICVPLFMILTGYLMCGKKPNRDYYFKIGKTLFVYIGASIMCALFMANFFDKTVTLNKFVSGVLEFTMAPYAWYVEMYIMFFLMIPFINLMYNGLESRKKKIILVGTFIVVAILPSLFNSFSFYETTKLWFKPENYDNLSKIFPNFWVTVYPFAYYFIGCYLREYRLKIKTIVLVILLVISIFLFGLLNLYRNFGSIWKTYPYADWGGFTTCIIAVLLFETVKRMKTNELPIFIRRILMLMSQCSLGIYLTSYIGDVIAYDLLNKKYTSIYDKFSCFLPTVLYVYVISLLLSIVIEISFFLLTKFVLGELKGVADTIRKP